MSKKKLFVESISLLLIIVLFLLASYFIQNNLPYIENYFDTGILGMIIYISITIIATVFAPVSAVPLIPIASAIYGPFLTAIMSIFSWVVGSIIAFYIARKYGVKLVSKFISLKQITKYEKMIPETHLFLSIVFIRVILPVDVLSYALGIFSKVKITTYILATLIGVTPFAFVLAYLGTLSLKYQLIGFILIIVFSIYLYLYFIKKLKK